jgi:hypothetical protein
MFTLFCLVHGDPVENAFAIDIERSKTISHLRELIKEKKAPEFDSVVADKLILWSVSISVDDTTMLEELVLENNKEKGVQKLLPLRKISKVFPSKPADEHIHIIVERPPRMLHVFPLSFVCFVIFGYCSTGLTMKTFTTQLD